MRRFLHGYDEYDINLAQLAADGVGTCPPKMEELVSKDEVTLVA